LGYNIIRKDGSKRYIESSVSLRKNSSGKPIGFLGISNDLTERKRAEEALKERDIVFKKLSANVPGMIYQFQMKPDGSFCLPFSTDAVKDIYGCSPEDIVNDFSPIAKAVYHEDFDRFVKSIKLSAKKMSPWQCEYRVQVPGKPLRWLLGTSTPEKLPDGSIIWHGFNTDITESKKAEKELEKYHEHLEELVRERTIHLEASNKELEAFSYSASHDLRAPLRSIEGFSQALLEDYRDKLDIQGKDYLTRIKTATKRMADLIEDMLQLSRITRMEMNIEKVNLTLLARSVINELQKSQPQRHVEIRIAESLEDKADLRLTRIILNNLLGNAWKFTERQAKAKIEFGLLKSEVGGKVYFIRDNGAGFDMAYADKLFAPFQRLHADDEFPGTGIGLATVRRIINRHGGKVWAEGEIDKGATFYFSLNEK
jgi:signal transduction histidine kinase